jgi:hypothetical protein
MFHMPGLAGRDGCYQRWVTSEGAKAFAFVNGPYRLLAKISAKIMVERADFFFLAPSWSDSSSGRHHQIAPSGRFVFRLPTT